MIGLRGHPAESKTMNPFAPFVIGWSLLTFCPARADDQKFMDYLTKEGDRFQLKHRLELRDETSGFAGLSGRSWVIEPDGHWKLARLQPTGSGKVKEVVQQSGELKPDEIVSLAKDLAAHDLAGLPANHGETPKINPHRLVLKFGDKTMVLNGIAPRRKSETIRELIAKSSPGEENAGAMIWNKWKALSHSIESRAEPTKP
jgi:hypothetical protein